MAEITEGKGAPEGVFDPKAQKEGAKANKALRAANMKAVFGSGVGRISLFVVGAAIMLLMTLGAYKLFGGKAPLPAGPMTKANEAVLNGPAVSGDATVRSEEEARMRQQLYQQQAAEAKAGQQPYMAPPIARSDEPAGQPAAPSFPAQQQQKPSPPTETDLAQAQRTQGQPAGSGQPMDRDMQRLRDLVDKIKKDEVSPQIQTALGRDEQGQKRAAFSTGYYPAPKHPEATSLQAAAPGTNGTSQTPALAGGAGGKCAKPIIQAGDSCYAQLTYGIDTDSPGRDVFARMYQCKGIPESTVIGKYDEAQKDVGATFDKLAIPGRSAITIQAAAFADETGRSGLADNVDNHYFQRFVATGIAALATGLGRAAQLPQGTASTTGFPGSTSTVVTQEPISGARQVKIAGGEVGTAIGAEIKKQNDSLRPTKTVNASKDIRVVFLSDVCDEKK